MHLVIHDDSGYILDVKSGSPEPREPIGVPFIWTDVPVGKQVDFEKLVDLSTNEVPLKDTPPTEMDELKRTVADLTELVLSGGM